MKLLHSIFKRLMGTDGVAETRVVQKDKEAIIIKANMNTDLVQLKKRVDKLNKSTYTKLSKISADLETTTYRIAVSTGGKERGL